MSKIDICISIIQTIKDYLFSTEKLKKHHEKKHFSRKRKLSLFQVIIFLIYSSKASMNINISRIRDELPIVFPNVSKQAVSKARQHIKPSLFKDFLIFLFLSSTVSCLLVKHGIAITYLRLMAQNLNFPIQNLTLNTLAKCLLPFIKKFIQWLWLR